MKNFKQLNSTELHRGHSAWPERGFLVRHSSHTSTLTATAKQRGPDALGEGVVACAKCTAAATRAAAVALATVMGPSGTEPLLDGSLTGAG